MKHHILRSCLLLLVLLFFALSLARTPVTSNSISPPGNSLTGPSARILVVYYSRTGNTERMARGVIEGAERVPGVAARLKKASLRVKAASRDRIKRAGMRFIARSWKVS